MPVELCPWEEPLLVAAVGGQTAKMKEELNKDKEVDIRDLEYGRTSLIWAAEDGHEDAVQLLLKWNANVNALDLHGRTPLLQAAANGHKDVTKQLLAANAHIECRDFSGHTPLILAAKAGFDSVVRSLLEAGADLDVQEWRYGRTALSWAAERGDANTVEILLDGNAAVDLADKLHRTPMSWAAMDGHANVVKLLLRWNASTETKDIDYDRTPFLWAIKRGHDSVIQILKGISLPEINYGLAARPVPTPSARLDELKKQFRTVKPDFDWRKSGGGEILIWAIDSCREEDVGFLIQQGADLNTQDDDGMTVLSHAASTGLIVVVKLLLERDVDPDPVDIFGRTPSSLMGCRRRTCRGREASHREECQLRTRR